MKERLEMKVLLKTSDSGVNKKKREGEREEGEVRERARVALERPHQFRN